MWGGGGGGGGRKSDCGFKLNINSSVIETLTRFFFCPKQNICHVREDLGLQENQEGIRNRVSWIVEHAPLSTPEKGFALFVSCRHDNVMTTREYARGRKCIPWTIPCVFAL